MEEGAGWSPGGESPQRGWRIFPGEKDADGMENSPRRIRITYAQLEREEYESVRKQKAEKAARPEIREKTASHSSTMERGAEAFV